MNTLKGINIIIIEAKEWISDLLDQIVESTTTEQNIEKKNKKNEDSIRDLWDNNKCTSICIIEVPEGGERKDLRKYLNR